MRNLNRITNYYNRLEAWNDYNAIAKRAAEAGLTNIPRPADNASWRQIDKLTAEIRKRIEAQL